MTKSAKKLFGGAVCALILLLGVSLAFAGGSDEASAAPSPAVRTVADARVVETATARGFILRSENGVVAVYTAGGEFVETAEINPATLRSTDRASLAEGIFVEDREALARLIEDLGS